MAGKDITLYEESSSTNLYPRTYTRNVFDEDGTTTLKTLLTNIVNEAGKIAEVKVNGTALTITNKSVNIDLSGYLSLNGGTINAGKTITFGGTTNATCANLKWGTVNSKVPYIGYASDQTDGTFVWSLTGTNYASGLAIGGGTGNLLWKGNKIAISSEIPNSIDGMSGGTLTSAVIAPQFKSDGTSAGMWFGENNELAFASNANVLYIGYSNRLNSSGVISEYRFGTHSGGDNQQKGVIRCGDVFVNNGTYSVLDTGSAQTVVGIKTFSNGVKVGSANITYDSTNKCVKFTFD